MNGMIKSVFLLVFPVLVLFPGCNGKKEDKSKEGPKNVSEVKGPAYDNTLPGREGMENTVLGYNQAIMDAHVSDMHLKFIRKYASEKETKRVFVFINTDRERGVAMSMKMNKIVFDNISTSETVNLVDTSENWDFHYIDIKTSKPTEPVKEMRYKLRYFFEKEDGKWVVGKLKEREATVMGEYNPQRWSVTGK